MHSSAPRITCAWIQLNCLFVIETLRRWVSSWNLYPCCVFHAATCSTSATACYSLTMSRKADDICFIPLHHLSVEAYWICGSTPPLKEKIYINEKHAYPMRFCIPCAQEVCKTGWQCFCYTKIETQMCHPTKYSWEAIRTSTDGASKPIQPFLMCEIRIPSNCGSPQELRNVRNYASEHRTTELISSYTTSYRTATTCSLWTSEQGSLRGVGLKIFQKPLRGLDPSPPLK